MSARHSAEPQGNPTARRVVLVGAVLLVAALVIGLALAVLSRLGIGGLCGDREEITVAAEPGVAHHVEALADEAAGCHTFEVTEVSSSDMAARTASREDFADLWVPDSAVRLAQVSQQARIPFDTVLNSIASTPVILATRDARVDLSTWTSALATPGLAMGDPVRSGIADAPILAASSEVENMRSTSDALGGAMAALAQGPAGRTGAAPSERALLEGVIRSGGAAVVSERQAVLAVRDAPDAGIELAAPSTGVVFLDHPLAVTTQDPTRRDAAAEAAEGLRDATASSDFAAGLADDGFRTADRTPLADGEGIGEAEALTTRDPERVRSTLQRWRLLSMPARSLVLVDTSGSMAFTMAGTDRTRIGALVETATVGLGRFPDDAALGLWAFGGAAGRDGRPYAELAPVAGLDATTPEGTGREALTNALGDLPGMVGGGTDLYQSVLDAYATARDGYDPDMINSIIVISDGANDNESALDREEFLERLRQLTDPTRPVVVVTVGLLDDADPEMLAEISRATGGSSHVAESPDQIERVFAEAIGARGGP